MSHEKLSNDAIELLRLLISIKSFSKEEDKTANVINAFLKERGIETHTMKNNVWAFNKHYDKSKPTVLLNSHHDTVLPNSGYTFDPFTPFVKDGILYGLGSNDAGGCLVSLISTFVYFYERTDLNYNFIIAATAEEEISGLDGVELILPELGDIEFAIVGEPTQMHLATSEKGLMVLDCVAKGKSGHAAREEGENAIYNAVKDIDWFTSFVYPKISDSFGPVKMSVTMIEAGSQHNVVPDHCNFVVDVRVTDVYNNEEILEVIRENVKCEINPRSVRLRASSIDHSHPIVQAGLALGRETYGSPTTSDQALIDAPSLKLGPGDSARSHTADEYVHLHEIKEGIDLYIQMLEKIVL
ncbi:MAG: M20 family metallo-hydrolase [Flavobacteriales bacterium]|nr:M20 family metallo-hydrolase [Flavobacteriales bacterium]